MVDDRLPVEAARPFDLGEYFYGGFLRSTHYKSGFVWKPRSVHNVTDATRRTVVPIIRLAKPNEDTPCKDTPFLTLKRDREVANR